VELIALIFMIVGGGALAFFGMTAFAIAQKENERAGIVEPPHRDSIAASLLAHILAAGGMPSDEALREVRRRAGLAAPITRGIDVANWAEAYARTATREQRQWLLETAVQLIAVKTTPVPLGQYAALLDLSFSLGFQTDALAKLREQYGFTYVDHAKDARPREAEHAPLFVRKPPDATELLRVLEIEGATTWQGIISAYRRLAAQHHPDRFFGQPAAAQTSAAARFIEITRAYEALMSIYRD
jgi:hypothetical protein